MNTYAAQKSVQITISESLLEKQKFKRRHGGIAFERTLPDAALPDCAACPKPSLGPINSQTVWLYSRVADQQQINHMTGHVLGLRFEALVAALRWFTDSGEIEDPDEVMLRIGIIDRVACKRRNQMVEQRASKPT